MYPNATMMYPNATSLQNVALGYIQTDALGVDFLPGVAGQQSAKCEIDFLNEHKRRIS